MSQPLQGSPKVRRIATSNPTIQRIMDAARSPQWSFGIGRSGEIMATFDTGVVGMPITVTAVSNRGALRVERFAPGDDVTSEGEFIGEIRGNPRELGRQLRALLEGLET